MKSLYTENLQQQYKTLQRNLVVAHFEGEILPNLSEDSILYWGMGEAGIENPEDTKELYNYGQLPPELEDSVDECVEVLFPFHNKNIDTLYIYLEILGCETNKEQQQSNPGECSKLKVSEYILKFM